MFIRINDYRGLNPKFATKLFFINEMYTINKDVCITEAINTFNQSEIAFHASAIWQLRKNEDNYGAGWGIL